MTQNGLVAGRRQGGPSSFFASRRAHRPTPSTTCDGRGSSRCSPGPRRCRSLSSWRPPARARRRCSWTGGPPPRFRRRGCRWTSRTGTAASSGRRVTAALGELVDLGKVSSSTRRPAPRPRRRAGIIARLERRDAPRVGGAGPRRHPPARRRRRPGRLARALPRRPAGLAARRAADAPHAEAPGRPAACPRGSSSRCTSPSCGSRPRSRRTCWPACEASLEHDEVAAAVDRAGGWAAGLQLTALASRSDSAQPVSLPAGRRPRAAVRRLRLARGARGGAPGGRRRPPGHLRRRADQRRRSPQPCPAGRTRATCSPTPSPAGCSSPGSARPAGSRCTRWSAQELLAEVARRAPERVAILHGVRRGGSRTSAR